MRTTILTVVVTLLVVNSAMSQSDSKLPVPIPLNHFQGNGLAPWAF